MFVWIILGCTLLCTAFTEVEKDKIVPHVGIWIWKISSVFVWIILGCTLLYTAFPDVEKDKIVPHLVIWICKIPQKLRDIQLQMGEG